MRRGPALTPGPMMKRLWRDYWITGDHLFRDELMSAYRPLASIAATSYARKIPMCVRIEELEAAALVGLWRAIVNFDSSKSSDFVKYSWKRIYGAMLDWMRENDWSKRRRNKSSIRIVRLDFDCPSKSEPVDVDEIDEYDWLVAHCTSNDNERQTLDLRCRGLTLREIGDVLRLSESRISQLLKKIGRQSGVRN